MTLMKSNTTRRSHPMMRSRFLRPTSKSMTHVLKPLRARPVPKAALEVVLPTPPLPEVITMILAKISPKPIGVAERIGYVVCPGSRSHGHRVDVQVVVLDVHLHLSVLDVLTHVLADKVESGDGHQLGFQALAEDASGAVPR